MPEGSNAGEPLLAIVGGTVVDALGERRADVLVAGTAIVEVGDGLEVPTGARRLDAEGCVVAPGLVDLHAHLREPGFEESETLETGARAAALGGYTAVVAMPNTDPPVDGAAVVHHVRTLAAKATCRVEVAGCITAGRAGERLAPMAEMAEVGVRIFTDDGTGVQDGDLMRRALEYARGLGVTLAQHCEDASLAAGGHMHEGSWSSRLGVPGIPAAAEEAMVARDIALARLTGGRLHLLHVSSAGSLGLVAAAKAEGIALSAEVAPHHLALSDAALAGFDPVFKVNPPLRSPRHVLALREACASGLVDAIATDHAPHPPEAKDLPLEHAAFGMLGLQTALPVAIGALCRGLPAFGTAPDDHAGPSHMSLANLLGLLSWGPARIAGIALDQGGDQGGPLLAGGPANICVIDPGATWTVDPAQLASRSSNTPYAGWELQGAARHTVFRGEPVVVDGQAQR